MERENLRVVTACIPVDGYEDTNAAVEIDAHGEYECPMLSDAIVFAPGKVDLAKVKAASKQQKMVYYRALAGFRDQCYDTMYKMAREKLAEANEVADRLEGHLKDAQAEVETLKLKLTASENANIANVSQMDEMRKKIYSLREEVAEARRREQRDKAQMEFYGKLKNLWGRLYWLCK